MGLLGAHMSIAGGLYKAIERGDELGCEAIQIFSQASRTWAISPVTSDEVAAFQSTLKKGKTVKKVVAHNSYLLNLTTANEEIRKKSVIFFIRALERCEALGIDGLITHPGSHLGAGLEAGIENTARSIDEVLSACSGFRSKIILENTAGQGDCIGHRFEHLRDIVDKTKHPEEIFFCFDTQHAFASGYDLRTEEGYESVMSEFDKLLSIKRIRAFHLNDALKDFNCRVDRHHGIGKGFLGEEAFRPLMNDERFENVPMCLETDPGGDKCDNYKRELHILRSLSRR